MILLPWLVDSAIGGSGPGVQRLTLPNAENRGLEGLGEGQAGNQRLYSEADLRRLQRIRHLVEQRGMNIAGLELALAMSDRLDALQSDATRAQMQTAIDQVLEMSREP